MPAHRERAEARRPTSVLSLRRLSTGDCLLVHRGQYDEAFFLCLDEAVDGVVLVLIVTHFLPDGAQVEANGRVTYHHLEAQFAYFLRKLLYLVRAHLVAIVYRQSLLDLVGELGEELV